MTKRRPKIQPEIETWVCEEEGCAKTCQKPWIYQILQPAWVAPDLLKALEILSEKITTNLQS